MGREGTEGGPGGTTPITSKESARVASANKTQETSKDGVQGHDSLPIAPAIAGFKSTGRTNILSNVSPSMEASTSYESLTAVGLVSPSIQGSTGVERNLNEKALSTKGGLLVSKGSVNAFPCKEAGCNANPEMSRKGTPLSYKHMLQGKKLEPSLAARLPSKDEKTLQPHAGNANGTDQKEACVPASVLENTEKSGDASNTLVAKGKANRPVEIIPCPRCKSVETKFCYYNNYNVRQPRHFCRSCQRYWTAGGTLRNVPVGAGRRKNKSSSVGHANSLVNDESKSTDGPGPLKPGALHFSRTDASMGSRMYPLAAHTFITPGTCPPIGSIHSTADLITKEAARTLHPEALGRKSHSPDVDEVTHLSLGRKTDNSLGSSGTVRGGSRHLVNSSEDQSSGEGEELTKQNKDAAKVQGIRVHRFNNPSIHPGYLGGPLAVGPHPWMQGMIPGLPWVKPIEQIPPKAGTKPEVQPAFPPVIPNYQGYIWPGAGYFPYGWIQDPQSPGWNAAVAASIGYSPLNMAQSPSLSYSQHPQGQQVPIAPIPVDRLGPNIASNRTQYGGGWIPMWPAGQPLATKPGTQNPTSTPVVTQAGTSRGVSTWEGRKGSGSTTLGKHSRSPETMR